MPLISVITPTFGREAMLPYAYRSFATQNIANLEWIVLDDSERPSIFMTSLNDSRVRYHYLQNRLAIGEKRNILIEMAKGEIIVQFDDDEYYAPHYIRAMLNILKNENADFVKLSSFFLYSKIYKKFGYWDLMQKYGYHSCWSAEPETISYIEQNNTSFANIHLGYGFSYVFTKSVWEKTPFEQVSFAEDGLFIRAAIANGFKTVLLNDDDGLCVHILHSFNMSKCFPQYVIPSTIVRKIFHDLPSEQF